MIRIRVEHCCSVSESLLLRICTALMCAEWHLDTNHLICVTGAWPHFKTDCECDWHLTSHNATTDACVRLAFDPTSTDVCVCIDWAS